MTYAIEGRDMLLHILYNLQLFRMEVESSFDNGNINLFPFPLMVKKHILCGKIIVRNCFFDCRGIECLHNPL